MVGDGSGERERDSDEVVAGLEMRIFFAFLGGDGTSFGEKSHPF